LRSPLAGTVLDQEACLQLVLGGALLDDASARARAKQQDLCPAALLHGGEHRGYALGVPHVVERSDGGNRGQFGQAE
jgi:hypothetical protein